MRREYFRIPPEMRKGFKHAAYFGTWQPRRVLNFHSVSAQTEQLCTIPERVPSSCKFERCAKIYRSLYIWFSYFCRHLRTFCECYYIHIWKICIPRSVQAKQILIGRFVECQSIKKVGGRRSVEELYQALFFVPPFPPECFTERNENRAWSQVSTILKDLLKYLIKSGILLITKIPKNFLGYFQAIYFPKQSRNPSLSSIAQADIKTTRPAFITLRQPKH